MSDQSEHACPDAETLWASFGRRMSAVIPTVEDKRLGHRSR